MRRQPCGTFLLFVAFGGGGAWYATAVGFMALPAYQEHFGLALANRLEVGYNIGTIPCALFLARSSRPLGPDQYVPGIVVLLIVHSLSLVLLILATPGSPFFGQATLVTAMALGGSVGYLAQFVMIPYLMHFRNDLVGAFWFGDAATAAFCAALALVWQNPRFSLRSYMLASALPVMLCSWAAFAVIHVARAGRLDDQHVVAAKDASRAYLAKRVTHVLALVVFWSQFADWGIGDSAFPFACKRGGRNVQLCELWANEISLLGQFAGVGLAALLPLATCSLARVLWWPTALYTLLFFWLLAASVASGLANDAGVVALMGALRFLGPYTRAVVPRLIQRFYDPQFHEALPVYFGFVAIVGNILGSLTATFLIQVHVFHD